MMLALAVTGFIFASISALIFVRNLRFYLAPPETGARREKVSIIIPARNEENTIGASLRAALRSRDVEVEVVVVDDGSDDHTAEIVREIASEDRRVRIVEAGGLPSGWNGKQHACWVGANAAQNEYLCFIDSDLRLSPDAVPRMLAERELRKAELISGIPMEEAHSWSERLMMPLISFLLLGYLPMEGVRNTNEVGFAAGIGQLFLCGREAYFQAGGHAAIRSTLHDGLRLPKLFREHGLKTDLFDAASIARCRMYENFAQVWKGLSKNAVEGMAAPRLIGIFTLLLGAGHVLPFVTFGWSVASGHSTAATVSVAAVLLSLLPRVVAAFRFKQSLGWAFAHPLAVTLLLVIQWSALVRHLGGRPSQWKGRAYQLP